MAAFARTLDPTVAVLFDHTRIDVDTGQHRQPDFWILGRRELHLIRTLDHQQRDTPAATACCLTPAE